MCGSSPYGRCLFQNKERERLREQETAIREREARYSNGHLFTSLTVSGTTLCSACNKSITAKEALSCPSKDTALRRLPGRLHLVSLLMASPCFSACNVTIHNRCRDALASCSKMKQRVRHRNTHTQNYTPQEMTHAVSHTPGLHRYSATVVVAAMHAPVDAGLDLRVYSSCPPACLAAPAEMGAAVWSTSSQTWMVTVLRLVCQKETPACLPVSRQVPPAQHHQVRLL